MYTFEMSIKKNHMFVTQGPYGIGHHPGYTGALLAVCGMLEVSFVLTTKDYYIELVTSGLLVEGEWRAENSSGESIPRNFFVD